MRYSVDKNSKESTYLQLYRQLRSDIVGETYKYGEKLPSKRLLSEESGVSVITVEHAYSILCDEGYVQTRERSGYFVCYKKGDVMPVNERREHVFTKEAVSRAEDEFPFSVFAKTMRGVISKYGERILVRSDNMGTPELRGAISRYLARSRGIFVNADQIVIGSGAEYLYGMAVQLLGRYWVYALENPSYEKIRAVYEANGIKCDLLEMGVHGILSSELRRSAAKVLHVTPFNSFPSGVTAGASKRSEYIRWAASRNGFIIEDDFASEFTVSTKHEDTLFSLDGRGRVIYINTFSKTIAPSMRVGYMVLPERLSAEFKERLGFYSCSVPVFDQYVLAEFIENGDFERHINRIRRKRRRVDK